VIKPKLKPYPKPKLVKKAAAPAQYNLGFMFYEGTSGKEDEV